MTIIIACYLQHPEPASLRNGLPMPRASTVLEIGKIAKELTMSMYTLTEFKCLARNQFLLAPISTIGNEPIQASSRDYSFDFDEDELARALLAPVPASILDRPIPTVEADEFERLYRWFNS